MNAVKLHCMWIALSSTFLVKFWSHPHPTYSINRKLSVYWEVNEVTLPLLFTATWCHCWHWSFPHTEPECPIYRTSVWTRFLNSQLWFFEGRLTLYLRQGSQTGCLWAKFNCQKWFIWQHTYHGRHYCLCFTPAWSNPLQCLTGSICAWNPEPGARLNQRSTMLWLSYYGSLNLVFPGDAQPVLRTLSWNPRASSPSLLRDPCQELGIFPI